MRVLAVGISLVTYIIGNLHLISCSPLANNQKYPMMKVLHLGDYIEVVTGVTAACTNVSQMENIEKKLINTFSTCLSKIDGDRPTEDHVIIICNNQYKYILCWKQLKNDILKECGNDKEPLLPALYVGTVNTMCGSDFMEKLISEVKNASLNPEVARSCPKVNPEVFQDFEEHCVNLLPQMESPDICIRRKAIQKCMDQLFSIVCTGPLPTLFNTLKMAYIDKSELLPCDN
ncbi:unnamed protein product [Orchesella dallaii]|uniref:Uncharacterized protein n=1 Tax=Orchesella dallaii TaxID=48710 RepID=A0ABP1S7Q0_9HEXA